MSATAISDSLRPYVPPSYYQGDTLKPGIDVDQAIVVAQGIQARAEALPPAEAKIFLAMVQSGDIAPGGQIPADFDKALDVLVGASKLIAGGAVWEDSMDVLARAIIEQSADQRKNALQDRLNARDQAKTELLSQAQTLKDQATELKDGATKAMVMSIVFSAVSIGLSIASGASFKMPGKGTLEQAAGFGQSFGGLAGSFGQVGQASSGYATTTSQAAAKTKEAEGQIDAAAAQTQQSIADIKKEAQDSLSEMIKSIINFLKEMQDAKAQQMQTLTRV